MPHRISLPQKGFIKDSDFRFRNLTGRQWHLSEPNPVPSAFTKSSLMIKMWEEIALRTKQDLDTTNITFVN